VKDISKQQSTGKDQTEAVSKLKVHEETAKDLPLSIQESSEKMGNVTIPHERAKDLQLKKDDAEK
jgi:hypothetical protein